MDEHKIGLSPAVIDEREGTEASGRRVAEAIEEKEAVFTIFSKLWFPWFLFCLVSCFHGNFIYGNKQLVAD